MCHSFTLSPWFFKISSFLPLSFIILQRMHPKEILFPSSKVHCFAYIRIASHRISNIFGLTRYFLWLSLHLQQYFVWQAKNQNCHIDEISNGEKPDFRTQTKKGVIFTRPALHNVFMLLDAKNDYEKWNRLLQKKWSRMEIVNLWKNWATSDIYTTALWRLA